MRVLLDTHTFIWFVRNSGELSSDARSFIESPASDVRISIASIWEMSIKTALGKLTLDGGFERVLPDLIINSIEIQEITFSHALKNKDLPFHHRDPFDRMIAAQALVEKVDLVSSDDVFDKYFAGSEVKRIW